MPPAPLNKATSPSPSLRIGEYSEAHLLKCAKDICERKSRGCNIFDKDAEDRIPVFESSGKLFAKSFTYSINLGN
jgi:hypothetical protein